MMSSVTGVERADVMVRMNCGPNNGIAFSPDGALLAVCSAHHIEIIDARRGAVLRLIRGHAGTVADAAFSPDGAVIVTGSDGTARTWEVATGRPLVTLAGHDGAVYAVAFSSDGTRIATASADESARIWDAADGAVMMTTAGQHFGAVQDVAFSPNGTRLATASGQSALVFDAVTGRRIASFYEHDDTVASVAFSPDGTLAVSGSVDETARVWDTATGQERTALTGHHGVVAGAAFAGDGTLVVTGSSDRDVRVWDAATGAPRPPFHSVSAVTALAVSPDGAVVATTTTITARTWEIATGRPGVTISGGNDYLNAVALVGHSSWINALAYAPSGAMIATGSGDGTARTWDAATGAERATLRGHTSQVKAVSFSPSGTPSSMATQATACGGQSGCAAWGPGEAASRFPEVCRLPPDAPIPAPAARPATRYYQT
jgi:WD40 repeat protein